MVSILSQYCINVRDLDRAIEFWEGVIGIPVQSRTDIPNVKEAVLQSPPGAAGCSWRNTSTSRVRSTWGLLCGSCTSTLTTVLRCTTRRSRRM